MMLSIFRKGEATRGQKMKMVEKLNKQKMISTHSFVCISIYTFILPYKLSFYIFNYSGYVSGPYFEK